MALSIEKRIWPVRLDWVRRTPLIKLRGRAGLERIARETGVAEARLAERFGVTSAGIETAKLLAINAADVPADFALRDGPRETEFVQAIVGRYGEEGVYDSLRRILAQLEPTEVKPGGRLEIYDNIGVVMEGEQRIPVTLFLDPKRGEVLITKGLNPNVWLTVRETSELPEQIAVQISQLAADLCEGIIDPAGYRGIISPQIEAYFADRARVAFPRKHFFETEVLAERRRRFAAVESYASSTPGMPADGLTVAQFIKLILRLCWTFASDKQAQFNKGYYNELLAVADSELGVWEKRLEAINVGDTNFVDNFLGSQALQTIGRPGGPDPLTARVNLAQVTDMDHGYAPIRNRFWVVPNEENTPMKGGYSLHGGRFFLMLHPAEESTHSQPWLDAYEVLMQAGVPVRISEQVKEWIRAEDLVERSAAEARRLNVPAAEIKCDTSIECGFRLRELRFL